jgi:hypothetical protein
MNSPSPARLVLRDLPLAVRLTLSAFLISVGIGYLAALVQLHLQHAPPGSLLPSGKDAVAIFHGSDKKPQSKIEALLAPHVLTAESEGAKKWGGQGQMSAAFTVKSKGWIRATDKRPEVDLRRERDGERLAVLAWIHAGADKKAYEEDRFALPADLGAQPITKDYLEEEGGRAVRIASILKDRCVSCHMPGGRNDEAANFPMDTYEKLKPYVTAKEGTGAMSLPKLAQSTHVHLLGFAMLYGLTGLIFAFTGYPSLARCLLAPLPLVVQMVDIGCWWLARLEAPFGPYFAMFIPVTGGIVAVGLLLHVVLGLFDLYGKVGKLVLVLLLGGVIAGGVALDVKGKISNYLDSEKAPAAASE